MLNNWDVKQKSMGAQFKLEQNVEYKVIDTPKLISLLKIRQVPLSRAAIQSKNLNLITQESLRHIPQAEFEGIVARCQKELFTVNKLGTFLLKQIRKHIDAPIGQDGKVKEGLLNCLSAYGVIIDGITGSWGNSRNIKNLVTNAGFAGVASRINGAGAEAAFTYIAMGTGAVAAAVTDTTLGTELSTLGLSRANSTASRVTTTQTNDTAQLLNTFTVTGTAAVTESGVLNAASTGVLLCRQVFSAINVVNGDSLQITWKIKAA